MILTINSIIWCKIIWNLHFPLISILISLMLLSCYISYAITEIFINSLGCVWQLTNTLHSDVREVMLWLYVAGFISIQTDWVNMKHNDLPHLYHSDCYYTVYMRLYAITICEYNQTNIIWAVILYAFHRSKDKLLVKLMASTHSFIKISYVSQRNKKPSFVITNTL